MIATLPGLLVSGLHLAIGDVDDLSGYVTTVKAEDPTHFGHLAGNDCMRRVGEATRSWIAQSLEHWPFAVCATFGGDEVIIVASGRPYDDFLAALNDLAESIRCAAPRACSFVAATATPLQCPGCANDVFRQLISQVDKHLFRHKAEARKAGLGLNGAILNVGFLDHTPRC
jgi:GGDEF domain-containing protein